MTTRTPIRRVTRNRTRTTVRFCTRLLRGTTRPNHLLIALTAFSRAVRAHRRLAKLAPRFFDSAVVNRETLARHAELQYRREWEPLLNKAYGLPPDHTEPTLEPHWYPSVPKSQRAILAIDYELASWQFWMNAGREAMTTFQHRRPHALISFSHLARLTEIGFTLAQLACGIETTRPLCIEQYFPGSSPTSQLASGHFPIMFLRFRGEPQIIYANQPS